MHAFVTTRLDYLNSLLYGMPDYIIKRLQRLLNAAARIITNLGKYDHITDAMKKLHWLPIESSIQYKVLVLVHACVHNVAPPYLSSLLTSNVPSREMRSSGETDSPSTDSQHGDIWQAIIRIWWAKIMEQFGFKIAYNSLTRYFQTGIKNTLIQICIHILNM